MKPLINILIRTSNRPTQFARCLKSIVSQNYPNIRIIISTDKPCDYIPKGLQVITVTPDKNLPYFYDCYCNSLKGMVTDGWFLFLDDDDTLAPNILSQIQLNSPAILVQLERQGYTVPTSTNFTRGHIGMPCLILHHSLKNIANIPGTGQGDYFWIKAVQNQVGLSFQPIVVVKSYQRGLGKPEYPLSATGERVA